MRLAPLNRFKPSSKIFYWPFQGGTSFVDLLCFCSDLCLLCLCASVYMCFVVTCWERADLLALVCGVFCEFVTFPLVSWVRCGTWLYRFLIFAPLLTLRIYLCNERQPYKGCPFTCNITEITRNETVWRMHTNNVKGVYYRKIIKINLSFKFTLNWNKQHKKISLYLDDIKLMFVCFTLQVH